MCMIEATAGEPPFAYLDADDVRENLKSGIIPEKPDDMSGKVFTTEDLDEQRQDEATRCITCAALVFDLSRCCAQCGNQILSMCFVVDLLTSKKVQFYYCYKPLSVTTSASRCSKKMEAPPDDEFEALRSAVRAATDAECTSLVHALQVNTAQDKLKTVVYCACAAEANGREPLLNAGAISRLVKLLGNGSETLAIWTMDALGNMASDDDTKNAIVAEGAIPMLVKLLQNGTETQRGFAAYVLGQLSINSASSTATIVESDAIPFLVGLLRAQTNIPKNFAAFALDGIAAVSDEYGVAIGQNGGIRRLIKLLRTGTSTLKKHAASVLARLANQDENRQKIARRGAITDFITLLRRGTEDQKESAAFALSFLATDAALCADMVKFGAIAPLVALLRDGTKGQKKHAVCTLGSLAGSHQYYSHKIADEGGIGPLVDLLRTGSTSQKGLAAQTLGWIAHSNEENRREIISDEVIELLGRANTRALATKARISLLFPFLRAGRDEQKYFVVSALGRLASIGTSKEMIVECGAIAPLVDLLKSDNAANKEQAAIALGRLAANDAVNRDQMKRHGAVGLLMAFLRTGNRQQKRRAETALQSIGEDDESATKRCRR
ncbi:hypothetical protein PC121_g9847 [Phytophthora cactorum]|uniref:Armadillo-type fold n=1 Tax=Phytophthora cactorum TaxID=29920 RepID=A0A8T1DUK2_9STRA|nr:hypothetical protein PC117_g9452 [Phytophthora cactorum]KAG3011510.1 hypothetical protein PC120_g14393 [Phytophthora cactorum]KAG3069337.1 hypothetical protein PC121_g9847 [Phytophthora cactorum]